MKPSIAAVIPAYNAENTIQKAIQSVLDQREVPEEIIVVDDGSSDSTTELVDKFGKDVTLIRQKNQGAAAARQTGTEASRSDYIAYLDADDWWPEGKIARCREIMAKADIDFMLTDLQRARPGDGPEAYLPRNRSFYPWLKAYLKDGAKTSEVKNFYRLEPEMGLSLLLRGFPVYPSTALVKHSVIEFANGWDARFRRSEDFDLGMRIARHFPLHYLDEVQAIVGLHAGNEDYYTYFVKQTEGDIKVLSAHLNAEPDNSSYRRMFAQALGRKLYNLGNSHRNHNQFGYARQSYSRALKYPGFRIRALTRLALVFWPVSKLYTAALAPPRR